MQILRAPNYEYMYLCSTGSELYSDLPLSAACLHAELLDLGGIQVGHACYS